jgi:hypothetical protein
MNIELPLFRQEKRNTCALACLRMVLAAYGTTIAESTLEGEARMQPDGTEIGELQRVARHFGLEAEIHEPTIDQLRQIVAQHKFAIAYIDRAVFELTPRERVRHSLRNATIHTVIPTRITAASLTYHDPLPPRITRKSIGLFQQAYGILGNHCVVCSKP